MRVLPTKGVFGASSGARDYFAMPADIGAIIGSWNNLRITLLNDSPVQAEPNPACTGAAGELALPLTERRRQTARGRQ